MKKTSGTNKVPRGFSLAEVLAALAIGAMVMVAVLGIYHRAEKSVAAVTRRLDGSRLPGEVLQRIAEDLDNVISSSSDARITIDNKFENVASGTLLPAARLTITRTIEDSKDKEQIFKEIIWQSSYDFKGASYSLTLYRSASGLNKEDKVLEKNKEDFEREAFAPICSGITFFKIKAMAGKDPIEKWNGAPPRGIVVTISFAEPYKKANGTFDVPDEEKITRTIAIDRTRKIRFDISTAEGGGDEVQEQGQEQDNTDLPGNEKPPLKSPGKAEKVK
ncbi:MAG: prepilin-type N-terminal cleavage/methylation domain-containing protein [Sedimentisphaerales bacterium]|nr:prepilin-type N-terminal cleavage/methylation domain-containing protein [Sedimentisphaerales bacterium]